VCGYPTNAGCVSTGTCVPTVTPSACTTGVVACGCFGPPVEYGCNFYPGYAPASIVSPDPCTDAGAGGLADAGGGLADAGDSSIIDASDSAPE